MVNICEMFYWYYLSFGKTTGNIWYTSSKMLMNMEKNFEWSKLTNNVIRKLNIHQIILS